MYSTFFVNNKTYGADDINKVLAHLTTQGVSTFVDSGDALMDLDTAMSNLTSEGAQVYDTSGCKVVSVGNGYYKISKGCYWLASGACIIFDDEGYVFEPNFLTVSGTEGTICYVYLRQGGAESEGVSNDINIIVSGEAPADTHALLATISSAGAITDKRKVAVSKLRVHSDNPVKNISFSRTDGILRHVDEIGKECYCITLPPEYNQYGYVYDKLCNGNNKDDYLFYLINLSTSWKIVSNYNTDQFLYARKTPDGIEFAIYYVYVKQSSYNLQLFWGEPL